MIRIRSLGVAAIVFLLLPLAAAGQPQAALPDWRERLPALPLDGPITPLETPRMVGGHAWPGFTRFCVEQGVLEPDGRETSDVAPQCLSIAAQGDGSAAVLALRGERFFSGATLRLRRDADGKVHGLAMEAVPSFVRQPRELLGVGVAAMEALAVPQQPFAPGDRFMAGSDPSTLFVMPQPERDMPCTVGGRAAYRGRPVLIADCARVEEGGPSPDDRLGLEILMRVAVEEGSGLIASQSIILRSATHRRRAGQWQEVQALVALYRVRFE